MSRRVTRLRLTVESKGIGRSSRFALQNAEIHVGDERPSEKGLLNAACAEGLNLRSGQTKEFECNGNGRFVTIAVRGSAILSLCEVQVYAIGTIIIGIKNVNIQGIQSEWKLGSN